jgi:hypothetical protein
MQAVRRSNARQFTIEELSFPVRCRLCGAIDESSERFALRAVLVAARLFGLAAGTHLRQLRNLGEPLATMQAQLEEARLQARLAWEVAEILGARLRRIPERRRPYYSPAQRFRILEIRSLLGWSRDITAHAFMVCTNTISNWERSADAETQTVGSTVTPTHHPSGASRMPCARPRNSWRVAAWVVPRRHSPSLARAGACRLVPEDPRSRESPTSAHSRRMRGSARRSVAPRRPGRRPQRATTRGRHPDPHRPTGRQPQSRARSLAARRRSMRGAAPRSARSPADRSTTAQQAATDSRGALAFTAGAVG